MAGRRAGQARARAARLISASDGSTPPPPVSEITLTPLLATTVVPPTTVVLKGLAPAAAWRRFVAEMVEASDCTLSTNDLTGRVVALPSR